MNELSVDSTRNLLLIADTELAADRQFTRTLKTFSFSIIAAETLVEATAQIEEHLPRYAIIDTHFADGHGLDVLAACRRWQPDVRAVIFSAYLDLKRAVRAMQLGAADVMVKSATAEEIVDALTAKPGVQPDPPSAPLSADRAYRDHIDRIFERNHRRVSDTARILRMHRRTLQRILSKGVPRK